MKESKPMSHKHLGWEQLTDHTITALSRDRKGIIFLLWGSSTQGQQKDQYSVEIYFFVLVILSTRFACVQLYMLDTHCFNRPHASHLNSKNRDFLLLEQWNPSPTAFPKRDDHTRKEPPDMKTSADNFRTIGLGRVVSHFEQTLRG
eukprot:586159-Amphidinium_carterae.1